MTLYDYNFFEYFSNLERKLKVQPLNLGGIIGSGGGAGGPPGGYLGLLPQTKVAYDTDELALSGFISPTPYDVSGILVSATLLDNLNHIRYRLELLEGGGGPGSSNFKVYENGTLVASNVTILDFHGAEDVQSMGGGEAEVTLKDEFVELIDTPTDYTGDANKVVAVKGDETGLEFITVSGGVDTFKVKVSANDTTEGYLEEKIVAGDNISVTVLNDGGNEDIEISATISGILTTRVIGFVFPSGLFVQTGDIKIHSPWNGAIDYVLVTVAGSPTGDDILVDINKNGTTIFTTQGNRPTILDGATDDLSSTPDITSLAFNDVLTCDIDQVGSTYGGDNLVVQVRIII